MKFKLEIGKGQKQNAMYMVCPKKELINVFIEKGKKEISGFIVMHTSFVDKS